MFYETHFAPLLRMQGFFNEVALDLVKADGTTMQVLANAAERREPFRRGSIHSHNADSGNRTPAI